MKKLSTGVRLAFFFGGLLLNFLMAGLLFEWPLLLRIVIAIILAFAAGVGSYGVIPTKQNMDAIRKFLRAHGKISEAEDVGAKDWLSWVLLHVVLGVLVQLLANWLA